MCPEAGEYSHSRLCVVKHHAHDGTLSCWSSYKGALIPGPYGQCMTLIASKTLAKNFKIRGGPMCKFSQDLYICLVALDTICGFKWVKK